jgi:hypothetical protein
LAMFHLINYYISLTRWRRVALITF